MRRFYIAIGAFVVCFTIGASLSLGFGVESRVWVPAGIITSMAIAMFVLYYSQSRGKPSS